MVSRNIFLIIAVSFFLDGCKKDELAGTSPKVTSGKIILTARVLHHQYPVAGCSVYIKSSATEFPGTDGGKYDQKLVSDPNGYVQFNNLLSGNYYLYATGYDVNFADSVMGYIPLTLEAKPNQVKEESVNIPVSE